MKLRETDVGNWHMTVGMQDAPEVTWPIRVVPHGIGWKDSLSPSIQSLALSSFTSILLVDHLPYCLIRSSYSTCSKTAVVYLHTSSTRGSHSRCVQLHNSVQNWSRPHKCRHAQPSPNAPWSKSSSNCHAGDSSRHCQKSWVMDHQRSNYLLSQTSALKWLETHRWCKPEALPAT